MYKIEEIIWKAEKIYLDIYKMYAYWKIRKRNFPGSILAVEKKLWQNGGEFKGQVK